MRRGWVWVLCGFFVIPRSDSEEAAATAWRPAGKGHSDSVVPPAVADFFWHDSTAPPARYAVAAGLTAEEVWKGLGFGVHPLRLQKTASLLHPLSRIAELCFRLLLRFQSLTRPASSAHPSFLLSQVSSSLAPYTSA